MTDIVEVLALPWGGDRNLAAKSLIEPHVGPVFGVGVYGTEQPEAIQVVCHDQAQASKAARTLKVLLPTWRARHFVRSDGGWVASATPPEG